MSNIAFRASLVREIEQTMEQVSLFQTVSDEEWGYQDGRLDSYAHVLMLLKDEDL